MVIEFVASGGGGFGRVYFALLIPWLGLLSLHTQRFERMGTPLRSATGGIFPTPSLFELSIEREIRDRQKHEVRQV